MSDQFDKAYTDQLEGMMRRARVWISENPKANPMIQFNYQKEVMVIADFEDAIEEHFLTINPDGRALIDAMCETLPRSKWPTAFMLRMVMDHLDDPRVGGNENPVQSERKNYGTRPR